MWQQGTREDYTWWQVKSKEAQANLSPHDLMSSVIGLARHWMHPTKDTVVHACLLHCHSHTDSVAEVVIKNAQRKAHSCALMTNSYEVSEASTVWSFCCFLWAAPFVGGYALCLHRFTTVTAAIKSFLTIGAIFTLPITFFFPNFLKEWVCMQPTTKQPFMRRELQLRPSHVTTCRYSLAVPLIIRK